MKTSDIAKFTVNKKSNEMLCNRSSALALLKNIFVDNGVAYATDAINMVIANTDLPDGTYDAKGNKVKTLSNPMVSTVQDLRKKAQKWTEQTLTPVMIDSIMAEYKSMQDSFDISKLTPEEQVSPKDKHKLYASYIDFRGKDAQIIWEGRVHSKPSFITSRGKEEIILDLEIRNIFDNLVLNADYFMMVLKVLSKFKAPITVKRNKKHDFIYFSVNGAEVFIMPVKMP